MVTETFYSQTDLRLNTRIMELWLNDTLQNASYDLDIEGGLNPNLLKLKDSSKKKPIETYRVDRLTLSNSGISQTSIDRIYRSLFVYSVGFYEMLKNSLGNCKNKASLISDFWKVYSILLEYCNKHDYQMQIQDILQKQTDDKQVLQKEMDFRQT
jgi:hypothetical protein